MKSGSSFYLLRLLSKGDAPFGDFCFEFLNGRDVLVDEAAELLAEFLPVEPSEGHQTVRKKTNRFGKSGRIRHWHASAHNLNSECRMIRCANST
jgi:hypothetical protein